MSRPRESPRGATRNTWLEKAVEQLRAMEGVAHEVLKDGRIALEIAYNGETGKLIVAASASDYAAQKNQLRRIRDTLTALGITEGAAFVPAKRPRRPMSPDMLAAREKQKKEFDAWQELWRTLRQAENALDAEFELSQMMDYY